jgi:hypothetical protein
MTTQAMKLGFLPRTTVRHTSDTKQGRIYVPVVNFTREPLAPLPEINTIGSCCPAFYFPPLKLSVVDFGLCVETHTALSIQVASLRIVSSPS